MNQPLVEAQPEPSLGALFGDLARETGTLVRKEVELAKVEMTNKAKIAGRDAALIAIGGVVAIMGAFALLAALILGLGEVMPLWASALLVGAIVAAAGGAIAFYGIQALKRLDATPRETIQTLQEEKRWLREQMSR